MEKHRQNIESLKSDKMLWLASQIFAAFPQEVTGLRFYILNCGCVYYQRVFPDGTLDPKTGIYRDAEDGPCEVCMVEDENWLEKVSDESTVLSNILWLNPKN